MATEASVSRTDTIPAVFLAAGAAGAGAAGVAAVAANPDPPELHQVVPRAEVVVVEWRPARSGVQPRVALAVDPLVRGQVRQHVPDLSGKKTPRVRGR